MGRRGLWCETIRSGKLQLRAFVDEQRNWRFLSLHSKRHGLSFFIHCRGTRSCLTHRRRKKRFLYFPFIRSVSFPIFFLFFFWNVVLLFVKKNDTQDLKHNSYISVMSSMDTHKEVLYVCVSTISIDCCFGQSGTPTENATLAGSYLRARFSSSGWCESRRHRALCWPYWWWAWRTIWVQGTNTVPIQTCSAFRFVRAARVGPFGPLQYRWNRVVCRASCRSIWTRRRYRQSS